MSTNKEFHNSNSVKRTGLCLGPMSLNTIHAIEKIYRNTYIPITLIASRNQVESSKFGGGYVNHWSTKSFSKYCQKTLPGILIGRDHGGPYLSGIDFRHKSTEAEALSNSLISFENDIINDFKFIHIDPSKYTLSNVTIDGMLKVLKELYGHCCEYAKSQGKKVFFEIGGEGHGPELENPEELKYFLHSFYEFLDLNKLQHPTYCVAKLGSYVKEKNNVGCFQDLIAANDYSQIKVVVDTIHKYNLKVKMHNADYLTPQSYMALPELNIDSINLAPQLGVLESSILIELLKKYDLQDELNNFYKLAYDSFMWKKWTSNDELPLEDCAQIAGHYIYSTEEFIELRNRILARVPDFDSQIIEKLAHFIKQTLQNLNNWKD